MSMLDSGQTTIQTNIKSTDDSSLVTEIEEIDRETTKNGTSNKNNNDSRTILLTMHGNKDDRYIKIQFMN